MNMLIYPTRESVIFSEPDGSAALANNIAQCKIRQNEFSIYSRCNMSQLEAREQGEMTRLVQRPSVQSYTRTTADSVKW